MADHAKCFDVPTYHANLWEEYAANRADVACLETFGSARAAGFPAYMGETFHRLYSESPAEIPADKRSRAAAVRAKLHALTSDIPEFETLRKQTTRDARWSGMASTVLADHVARAMPERLSSADADKAEEILASLQGLADDLGMTEPLAEHIAGAQGAALGAGIATLEEAHGLDETAVRNALRAGIEAAHETIDDAKEALSMLGWGSEPGRSDTARDPGVAIELARRVAGSAKLRAIVAMAGRLTLTARAKRASRTDYARSETTGVEPTSDVERLLPTEMIALSDPLLTADLFRKLVEGAAMGYKVAGKEKEGKGPIVVVIDQSGSMKRDNRDVWAKAITLAILDTARLENRAFGIVLYDETMRGSAIFPDARNADPREILTLLSTEPDGGTSYLAGLTPALEWIEKPRAVGVGDTFKRADIVHISDGLSDPEGSEAFKTRAKAAGAHIFGILIAPKAHSAMSAIGAWSDDFAIIDDVTKDTPAVDLVFDNL